MFFVLNKQKIIAYGVSVFTVIFLFCVASGMNGNNETMETSANTGKLLPIYNVKTEENKVALTMNCAWNADDVDSILETLKNNNVKITFFVVGDWLDKYPEAAKKIAEAGNEIASHSKTYPKVANLSYEENVKEIKESVEKIEKITGQKTTLYRPPYGEYNNTVISAAQDNGYKVIQWNLDTLDYTGLTGDKMWKRIEKAKAGDIILSHNGTEHTADSLDMIIKNIKQKGLEIVKVSDLIYKENYEINFNGTQIKN